MQTAVLVVGLVCSVVGCRAPRPTARELLEVLGERRRPFHADPRQTFEAFRLAFRGRLYDLEYNCFSDGFKERQGVGQLTYREVRDEALGSTLVAWALWKAEVSPVEYLDARRARLTASYAGRTVRVDFVREDFWETWASGEKQDAFEPWESSTYCPGPEEFPSPAIVAVLPLPDRAAYGGITELRVGQEWKIDHFEWLEGPSGDPEQGARP